MALYPTHPSHIAPKQMEGLSGTWNFNAYTDSDYAGDKVTRKSTLGFAVLLNGAIITWSSQKQPCVSLSSTEAEYIALTSGAREVVWLREFLDELGYNQRGPTTILVDQSAIRLVMNPEMHARSKHIDVRFHCIRELVSNNQVQVEYVPTDDHFADCLTKSLLKGKLHKNHERLGIKSTQQGTNHASHQQRSSSQVASISPTASWASLPSSLLSQHQELHTARQSSGERASILLQRDTRKLC
ncbi:unnamed protein product [Allacma fusca]|uniref:Uncharacterized protein n=1 Tax=Allacma fusca TaxID=39272 RepID=A0A8J2NY96_9HEXA|nr:unnamed protein product [Allacma fusca]